MLVLAGIHMAKTKQLGNWGERYAAAYLEKKGFRLVAQNWRCRAGELDLIMQAGPTLVFVEVKTRRGDSSAVPELAMTAQKQAQLFRVIEQYLHPHEIDEERDWRLDMVGVALDSDGQFLRCTHYEGLEADW